MTIIESIESSLGFGYDILVWGVGILAVLFSVLAFQFKRRFSIIICSFLGQSTWVLYFLLQSDLASAIACLLTAIMLAVFSKRDKWKWATGYFSIGVFIVLISGFSLYTFAVWSDIFPLLAGIFAVLANSRSDPKRIRQLSVLWCLCWSFNSIFKMYPIALINDLTCTASSIIALYRYRQQKSK